MTCLNLDFELLSLKGFFEVRKKIKEGMTSITYFMVRHINLETLINQDEAQSTIVCDKQLYSLSFLCTQFMQLTPFVRIRNSE